MWDTLHTVSAVDTGYYYFSVMDSLGGVVWRDTLHLSLSPVYSDTVTTIVCPGSTYVLPDNSTVNNSGIYTSVLGSISGCDSTIITILSHYPVYSDTVEVGICNGESYLLPDGNSVIQPGIYPVTLSSVNGCDSVIVTNLSVYPVYAQNVSAGICNGENYLLPDGSSVTQSGIYPVTLTSVNGCDSMISTNLSVYPVYAQNVNTGICNGENYLLPNGVSVSQAGIYPVTLTSVNGCDSVISTNLTVYPVYADTVQAAICNYGIYLLPDGASVTQSGTYPVTLSTINGCDSVITTVLTVHPLYADTITATICQGESYLLPNGIAVTQSGNYGVKFQSVNQCDSLITTALTVLPAYSYSILTHICRGESYLLPNGQSVGETGIYPVTFASQNGCDSVITTHLTVFSPPAIELGQDKGICEGETLTLTAPANMVLYEWNGNPALNTPNLNVTETGIYWVKIQDINGCTATDSFRIMEVYPTPSGFLPSDTAICPGNELLLRTQGGFESYLWSTGQTTPEIRILTGGLFTLEVLNAGDCSGSDTIFVREECPGLYLPNVFTPNGDGENEFFFASGTGVTQFSLILFDRWGKEITRFSSLSDSWDGTIRNRPAPEGTYSYTLKAVFIDGKVMERGGTVILMR